jgi:hypothetical protein
MQNSFETSFHFFFITLKRLKSLECPKAKPQNHVALFYSKSIEIIMEPRKNKVEELLGEFSLHKRKIVF